MKYITIIYNSFLCALTIATICFKNEWLQMRVNMGLIFFGLWIVLSVAGAIFSKRKDFWNWKSTTANLIICTLIGILLFGFARMKVVPAALIREGLNQTKIPFHQINVVLLVITVAGYFSILIADLKKKRI